MIADPAKLKDQLTSDWLPTIAWIRQGSGWSTKIAFGPKMVTLSDDVFKMEARFFNRGAFLGRFTSRTIRSSEILRVDVGDALSQIGAQECDGIAEIIVSGEGPWSSGKRVKCIFDVWMEITSADGKMHAVGPTGQFVGSNRIRALSSSALETYPGVPVNDQFSTDLLLMNPYLIPIGYWVVAFNCRGERLESIKKTVDRQHYTYIPLDELIPGLRKHAQPEGSVSLMVASKYKLITYCLFKNDQTKTVTALDHTWPYLEFTRADR